MNSDEQIFEHTGIRIMKASNGDIIFCDPGVNSGIRDYILVAHEAKDQGAILWKKLMEYIDGHERARETVSETFSYQGSPSEE